MTFFGHQLHMSALPFGRKAAALAQRRTGHLPGTMVDLASVPPGCCAQVLAYTPQVSSERQAQLSAYGLAPGYRVRVVQHKPVTIVQVEHLELALETELARGVQVILED
jgi:Fe2+ transport system protein FeoA